MLSLTKGGITMATIKSFTSLEQSKKLAEILPIESADMTYCAITEGMREKMTIKNWEVNVGLDIAIKENLFSYRNGYVVPCWSLAALLNVLPNGIVMNKDSQNGRYHFSSKYIGTYVTADNPVDACYKLILKLNELNLL